MTQKIKEAFKKSLENRGSVSKAMLEVGYAPATAKNPKNLTQTKAWKELLDEYFPDDLLGKVGKEGLEAWKVHTSHTEPDREIPDYQTRHRYYETALKLKRHLGPDVQLNQINMGDLGVRVVNRDAGR